MVSMGRGCRSRAMRAAGVARFLQSMAVVLSIVHGFLLVMRKPARIQAAKNRRKNRLRFSGFCESWDCHIAALAVSVFRRPASWRVFFFYVMGSSSVVVTGESLARNRVSTF